MRRALGSISAIMLVAGSAMAQNAGLAPMPESPQQRITPETADPTADSMYSTHDVPKPLPWQKTPAVVPAAPTAAPPKNGLPASMPFGHADAPAPIIPTGPHSTVAVPVVDVDRVEASEPAPATPVAPAADPAKEDPAQPTELTSPIFDEHDSNAPRKIIVRVQNKVTGQSVLYGAKPGDVIKFGRLEISALMCRASAPESQTDYAGLLDIREHLPGKDGGMKPLFRGWMYASSPSISGLEHPVYDVTMIECAIMQPVKKDDDKPTKKDAKPKKK